MNLPSDTADWIDGDVSGWWHPDGYVWVDVWMVGEDGPYGFVTAPAQWLAGTLTMVPDTERHVIPQDGWRHPVGSLGEQPAPWPCAGARCRSCEYRRGADDGSCAGQPPALTAKSRAKALAVRREQWSDIRKELAPLVYARDGYTCVACGTSDLASLTCDHVLPVSAGGSDSIDNLQTMCRRCNSAKGAAS